MPIYISVNICKNIRGIYKVYIYKVLSVFFLHSCIKGSNFVIDNILTHANFILIFANLQDFARFCIKKRFFFREKSEKFLRERLKILDIIKFILHIFSGFL